MDARLDVRWVYGVLFNDNSFIADTCTAHFPQALVELFGVFRGHTDVESLRISYHVLCFICLSSLSTPCHRPEVTEAQHITDSLLSRKEHYQSVNTAAPTSSRR